MSDALFDLADFEETAPVVYPAPMFPCGKHRLHATQEAEAHGAECWGGRCPSCRDEVVGYYDVTINHSGAEIGHCTSLTLRLNHLSYDVCNGSAPSARDLTVLDLGWRIAPDGTQIPPAARKAA